MDCIIQGFCLSMKQSFLKISSTYNSWPNGSFSAVDPSEVFGLNESEELTNGLLEHVHNHVVELKVGEASLAGRGVSDAVDTNEDGSKEATKEGSHVVPGLVTSAGAELGKNLNWVGSNLVHLVHNVHDALDVAFLFASHNLGHHESNEEWEEKLLQHFYIENQIIIKIRIR